MAEHGRFDTIFMETPWYYWGPPRSLWKEWRAKHKAIVWYFWMAYAAVPPTNRILRLAFNLTRKWCKYRYEKRWFRLRTDWVIAFYGNCAYVLTRWFFKGLTRVQPFWGIYKAFRALRPAKSPDSMNMAGIPRSI